MLPFRYINRNRLARGIRVSTHPTCRLLKIGWFLREQTRQRVVVRDQRGWSGAFHVDAPFLDSLGSSQGFKIISIIVAFNRLELTCVIFTELVPWSWSSTPAIPTLDAYVATVNIAPMRVSGSANTGAESQTEYQTLKRIPCEVGPY